MTTPPPPGSSSSARYPAVSAPTPSDTVTPHSGLLRPPSEMAISSGMSNAAVALPDVLQSYAQSKRLGTLVITRGDLVQHLGLAGGRVVSISGTPPGSLLRSLVWCGHLAVERSVALAERLGTDDAEVARELLEEEGIPMEQVADAISCLVEETFHHALIEQTPEWDLAPEEPPDEWVHIQQSIGVGIGISGLLMECMRRRDEFASIGEFLPEDWDLVIRSQGDAPEGSFSDDQRLVFGLIDDRTPAWEVVDRTWMIPSFANLALAQLLQRGYVKLANERELVLLGDACKEAGDVMRAEGYYARALDLGAHLPRVRFSLGELMAARGANQQAASVFLQAGDELAETRPSEAAIALRNALRLGADPVLCLRRLVLFYEQLDQPADARDALWQLVDRHDQQGEFHEALQAVAELEALGAEERPILERRGVLSERLGETAQALACWDGLLQHIDGDEEPDARTRIQGRILAIDPSRAAIAIDQGRRLQAAGALGDAATMLRSVLTALGDEADPALAIQLHEILAECDPTDTANRQWLARQYRDRQDRQGALAQLNSLAQTQEQSGDRDGLIATLEQIADLDPLQIGAVQRLTGFHREDGRDEAALRVWLRTVEANLAHGDARQAVDLGEEAARAHALSVRLRLLLVKGANRLGDKDVAMRHAQAAARLARIAGDHALARQCLQQLLPVRPDDLALHQEVLELAEEMADPALVQLLGKAVNLAMSSRNYGLACQWSERRVELLGDDDSWEARAALVEAYHRAGRGLDCQGAGEHLADDLINHGRQTEALEQLESLVAHYPRSPNLLLILTRLYRDLGRKKEATAGFQRMIVLLQQEDRVFEAKMLLNEVRALVPDRELLERIESQLEAGEAVTW